jgi:hypothetical protein
MISTVTTSTVSTVTLAGSFAIVGIGFLLLLLVQKEISTTQSHAFSKRLSKVLNFGIFPLFVMFVIFIFAKIMDVIK